MERILAREAPAMSPDMRRYFGLVIRLHHMRYPEADRSKCELPSYSRAYWEAEQDAFFARVCAAFRVDFRDVRPCPHVDAGMMLLWGLEVLSDWLASGQDAFARIREDLEDEAYCLESERAARETLAACGLKAVPVPAPASFPEMFAYLPISRQNMRPLQRACEEMALQWQADGRVPGLVIIEAPMGEGKTEAALYLLAHLARAFGKTGFYDAMPTGATSNAMFTRVAEYLAHNGGASARLVHSQSFLVNQEPLNTSDTESAADASAWLAPSRRALLSQHAVGTVDQIMMSVLQVRYGVLRLLGASAKVVVIDEVHAYDTYMLRIIEELLRWLSALRVPVVLLSATLPKARRARLLAAYTGAERGIASGGEAYPLITQAYFDGEVETRGTQGTAMRARVGLTRLPDPGDWGEIARMALSRVEGGGCLCILLNTVREAQAMFAALEAEAVKHANPPWIGLFHARFPMEDRQRIEEECVALFGKDGRRPARAVLISTQVCEQSLDLDFDDMITYLCPIDLLLQRMGRLHRHDRVRPPHLAQPRLTVLVPENEKLADTHSARIYHPWILRMSKRALSGREYIDLPEDIRPLVEAVYGARPEAKDELFEEWAKLAFGDSAQSEAARCVLLPSPDAQRFSLYASAGGFRDEDADWLDPFDNAPTTADSPAAVARTRMGMDGVRIALLDPALYQSALRNPDKATARAVLKRSLSVSSFWFDGGAPEAGENAAKGDGLLRGIWLLRQMSPETGYLYKRKGRCAALRCDVKLGVLREEGDS